jgi:hypothetical protein
MKSLCGALRARIAVILVVVAAFAAPVVGHHSFGRYEMTKMQTIQGKVDHFEWSNPHCWLFVTVEEAGKSTMYGFEMSSVGEMLRRGWKKTSLKSGDAVKVEFRPLRDASPAGLLMNAYDGNGKIIGMSIRPPAPAPREGGIAPPPGT